MTDPIADTVAPPRQRITPLARGKLSVLSGEVTLCLGMDSCQDTRGDGGRIDARPQWQLQLSHKPVVIGRAEGAGVPYLDPSFLPSPVMPTGKTILQGEDADLSVSRGHFMLCGSDRRIVLTNGVPRPDGSIRPPMNGTWLLAPDDRPLAPAEQLMIDVGDKVVLRLPNGARIEIECG